ncbi:DNA cytosine methyltransferase [Deinococcus peraridilitoris]|uniref:DNA (cytosine-5-)-methyltransferase n=1 Tax=Deinococcus peraridilitoris (strain DSM 19664 / LMG 22246 / CIP 109416 / KR-200) TaxID=937777 RepID=L0A364_DEIPD|nr:DNA cytosine methyltransferase [Deinococcus peraridilitoris]AFZ67597.1 site-specific DNA methylase [Deinococcus peraridilitoris DSM 19664]
MTLTVGSLFAGIGGLESGLELTGGFKTIWQVEIDPFARAVLEKHWPDTPRFTDVRDITATLVSRPDVICGGFPCQDISSANTASDRLGLAGEKSGLWSEYARIVHDLRPRWVIVENSPRWRDWVPDVRRDLWGIGYASLPIRVRAADVGALHQRPRVFVLAHTDRDGKPLRAIHAEASRLQALPVAHGYWRHTPPGTFRVADGLPEGMDRARNRTLGNAVSPEVARWVGQRILNARTAQ